MNRQQRRREKATKHNKSDDLSLLGKLAPVILADIGAEKSADDGLYVLTAGIVHAVILSMTEFGELTWMVGVTDQYMTDLCIEVYGAIPNLPTGALDRARAELQASGWISWMPGDGEFVYLLKVPDNWRELVRARQAGSCRSVH